MSDGERVPILLDDRAILVMQCDSDPAKCKKHISHEQQLCCCCAAAAVLLLCVVQWVGVMATDLSGAGRNTDR